MFIDICLLKIPKLIYCKGKLLKNSNEKKFFAEKKNNV